MKIFLISILTFLFIGCSNKADNGSTIHNESNINPSLSADNNTVKLNSSDVFPRGTYGVVEHEPILLSEKYGRSEL